MNTLENQIKSYAISELGFDDCRICTPYLDEHIKNTYRKWLAAGYAGDMSYLQRHWPLKEQPEDLLPGVKSAIMVIKNYKNTNEKKLSQDHKIARYAVGKDYHLVIAEKLRKFETYLKSLSPDVDTFVGVDSRPIAERSLALKAGLGFLGKNTMVIQPGLGSYFFIGGVLTSLPLSVDEPLMVDCGQCRLCVDACPTQALNEDFTMDATQCISYMTIEQKEGLSDEQKAGVGDWMYGCDICQEVCPYNHGKSPLTDWEEFLPKNGLGFDYFDQAHAVDDNDLPKISKKTPIYRSRKQVRQNWKTRKGVKS